MRQPAYEYHPRDQKYAPIHFYYDKLAESSRQGYNSYSEAIEGLYDKTKSMRQVGDIFKISQCSVWLMLKKMGKPRGPAGGRVRRKRAEMFQKECKHHGMTDFYVNNPWLCVECQRERNARRNEKKPQK